MANGVREGQKPPTNFEFSGGNPLNAELNRIHHLLALLEANHIFHVRGLRVNNP